MSSIPQNKQQLLDAINDAFQKIIIAYKSIPESLTRIDGIEGNIKGSTITVCDTLAYLIGWEKLVLKWYERKNAGKAVDFPETGFKWNELGLLAQHFHSQYQDTPYSTLIAEFESTTSAIVQRIESLTEHQLYGEPWYKNYPLGKMIQYNTSSPMKNMRTKVRKFKKQYALYKSLE